MKLDLNGSALTLCDLEEIVRLLERDGSVEVVGARRDFEGSTLLRLGAFLAEGAKAALKAKKVVPLNGGFVVRAVPVEQRRGKPRANKTQCPE